MGKLIELANSKANPDRFLVTVVFRDGEKFGRVYTDPLKAKKFANRQMKWKLVKSVRVQMLD